MHNEKPNLDDEPWLKYLNDGPDEDESIPEWMESEKQHGLFDSATSKLPPSQPVETSQQAAQQILPVAGTIRAMIYKMIKDAGFRGVTDAEIQEACGLDGNTARPRRYELVNEGAVIDSGRKRTASNGRSSIVWIAKED